MATMFALIATKVTAAGAALGIGGGAAAGTAAAAAGGAATTTAAVGATAGGLGTLSTAATVLGGLAALSAGFREKSTMEQQAVDQEAQAVQETITGKEDALRAMQNLNNETSKIAVAGFASGIGGAGSVEAAQAEAYEAAEYNVGMSRTNAKIGAAARRSQASQSRSSGRGAANAGLFEGISGGLSLYSRRAARG